MFNSIEEAIEDIKKGKPIIIVDDEDRENEGDLVIPAQVITEETVNFMIKEARGLMCVPITKERADELELNLMTANNTDSHGTAFTISVDSLEGTTTGISVGDRYRTIKDILNPQKKSKDFKKPGHLFPLIASKGGVLDRKGHTEASVDLAKICGYEPVSVIIEIIKDDGEMARRDDLMGFAKKYDLKIITIDHIIDYRKKNEDLVTREVEVVLPTKFGDFKMAAFSDEIEKKEYIAVFKGDLRGKEDVLVRLHSECLTGDIFGSKRCDCGDQLHKSLESINEKGEGLLIYLRQEGRGIGIYNKLKAYNLQDQGHDTVEANHLLGFKDDLRDFAVAAQIIKDFDIKSIEILTNNPKKIESLEKYGIDVKKRIDSETEPTTENKKYLETKRDKMGHYILKK
ncbi:MAG: bifunctional 3,4-dihydroxy-2-butanone-4-phosphate synthase/GTP cyclohydrolase II [Leptotrichiaceae bacterium]|nr:bifunctional 3,4-dihydroxy-2-butanone-4-phosphate synthase/GTP cyclohydrolase II [Leptotrichiaceae bacterium]MBP6167451.1 bifunctional 3,4-dihydroxy-2-butanone-4-phosphate synthase/GTP cyclohydrolase II [Leptotrichiaceae bacterium]MBP7026543.1 bifunctional 3,4-dihydroxy-2-butanone-4-phosphate synthase/GTP cyclohydrolase II [Leptotrichiaceae bacterium]MBP9539039.1 bifunctional 3,4-dihydroxy-2-butanone-4-phosphate synthase/GTP cyclohydrolase II [Leptotrichiaceae bacterium]MBP9876470.1 bifuncti